MSTDPAVEAAKRAWMERYGEEQLPRFFDKVDDVEDVAQFVTAAARETLKPIREKLAEIKGYYSQVEDRMLAAENPAETSRHANEMAGIRFVYDALLPLVYTSEELT